MTAGIHIERVQIKSAISVCCNNRIGRYAKRSKGIISLQEPVTVYAVKVLLIQCGRTDETTWFHCFAISDKKQDGKSGRTTLDSIPESSNRINS